MKKSVLANIVTAVTILAAVSAQASPVSAGATAWNLAGDYLADMNPNGPWSYGQVSSSGAFSLLSWNADTDSYGVAAPGEVFVYQNTTGVSDFGIGAGKVSLQSDWGNAAVRWIAPSSGTYAFTIDVGGSTSSGPNGFGNMFAQYAVLTIDGAERASDLFADNVKQWNFTAFLDAGSIVVASVMNPGFAAGGNTQTDISISTVPEPASSLLLGVGFALLICLRKRSAA